MLLAPCKSRADRESAAIPGKYLPARFLHRSRGMRREARYDAVRYVTSPDAARCPTAAYISAQANVSQLRRSASSARIRCAFRPQRTFPYIAAQANVSRFSAGAGFVPKRKCPESFGFFGWHAGCTCSVRRPMVLPITDTTRHTQTQGRVT